MHKKISRLMVGVSLLGISFAAVGVAVWSWSDMSAHTQHINVLQTRLIYNPEDVREVAGTFSDIFTGRVIAELGTKNLEGVVQTQYSVEVLNVIKGGSKGTVTVSQLGGYHDNEWTVFVSDVGNNADVVDSTYIGGYFLEPEKTYLFATLPNKEQGWYVVSSDPLGLKQLNIDVGLDVEAASREADNEPQVMEMKEAVKHQVMPSFPKE